MMTANNHYAGFGHGTVNIFRNLLGLPDAKWEEERPLPSVALVPPEAALSIIYIAPLHLAGVQGTMLQ